MTNLYFIAVWDRPRIETRHPVDRKHHGESDLYFDEDELIRECVDRDSEPESVIQMKRDGMKWIATAYELDMRQINRDLEAERRQNTPRYGT